MRVPEVHVPEAHAPEAHAPEAHAAEAAARDIAVESVPVATLPQAPTRIDALPDVEIAEPALADEFAHQIAAPQYGIGRQLFDENGAQGASPSANEESNA